MRSEVRKGALSGVIFVLVVMLLPQFVVAETQTAVTEIANFAPCESNNDEVMNIANDTIEFNYQTWDPLPSGIFVGGLIKESLIELREYPIGVPQGTGAYEHYSETLFAQPVKLTQDYVMTGTSQWVVRMPVSVADFHPLKVDFKVLKMSSAVDYKVVRRNTYDGVPSPYVPSTLDVVAGNDTELHAVCKRALGWSSLTDSPSSTIYVRDGRVYFQVLAPLHPDAWYLLVCYVMWPADVKFQFYLCPADLCSDNVTSSRIAYEYHPASDQDIFNSLPIPADLGFSFVFQAGLGESGVGYSRMFGAGDTILFQKLIPIGSKYYYEGVLNFVLEFRVGLTETLTWGVHATARIHDGATNTTTTILNHDYWTGKQHNCLMVASNPTTYNYTSATLIDGVYYVIVNFDIYIESAQRVQFMLVDNAEASLYYYQIPYQHFSRYYDGETKLEVVWFDLWATASLDSLSLNWTGALPTPHHSGFWEKASAWWDRHWMDIAGILLIIGGVLAAPFTLGGSFVLVSMGVGLILYNNWPEFRNFVNNLIKFVLDGLEWLGNWLWKIGMAIWKALTWFVDQLVYYGSILVGLLIIGVAIALFVLPIKWELEILGAFESLARGDVERAKKQFGETASSMRGVGSKLTGGRI